MPPPSSHLARMRQPLDVRKPNQGHLKVYGLLNSGSNLPQDKLMAHVAFCPPAKCFMVLVQGTQGE